MLPRVELPPPDSRSRTQKIVDLVFSLIGFVILLYCFTCLEHCFMD